jgi:hypothetical protein
MVRSEGDMSLKNPVTPWGIDPGTVRLVAQRHNHYTTPGPSYIRYVLNSICVHNYHVVLRGQIKIFPSHSMKEIALQHCDACKT